MKEEDVFVPSFFVIHKGEKKHKPSNKCHGGRDDPKGKSSAEHELSFLLARDANCHNARNPIKERDGHEEERQDCKDDGYKSHQIQTIKAKHKSTKGANDAENFVQGLLMTVQMGHFFMKVCVGKAAHRSGEAGYDEKA
ncbi:MAG: hypothetical protein OSB62_04630 [Alphaproteobacteria bacterium]|nr:hypothetical protein [Alphaproteobacteria bacterium]